MSADPLVTAQEAVRDAERRLHEAREKRDRLIKKAIADGASNYAVAKRIGITAQAIHAITKRRKAPNELTNKPLRRSEH